MTTQIIPTTAPWEAQLKEILNEGPEDHLDANRKAIMAEMGWLQNVIQFRVSTFLNSESTHPKKVDLSAPDLQATPSPYADFIRQKNLTEIDRLIVLLALAPHLYPEAFDSFSIHSPLHRFIAQSRGAKGITQLRTLPTVATAEFVLGGGTLQDRFGIFNLFADDRFLIRHKIISLERIDPQNPFSPDVLRIGTEYLTLFTTGAPYRPRFSSDFPAQRLTTQMEWDDLVLDLNSKYQIDELLNWLKHEDRIMEEWGGKQFLKPGFRSLFYGPPGTGKTLTATLIGKVTQREVFQIDASKVVSKFIGETEKNLARIFDEAENRDWILFFDEADALFGKRTQTSDAKDRYANQEVAYLLQRIEKFAGVVLLATNLWGNLDPAFMRRFQSLIKFPIPSGPQRKVLWERCFEKAPISKDIDFKKIAKSYDIAGGMIINVFRSCCLTAVQREDSTIYEDDIIEAIKEEYRKEGKTI